MIIITSPNFDSENDIIKKEILKFSKKIMFIFIHL